MAKRRKKKSSGEGVQSSPTAYPQERRANGGIEEAENGYVVRVSSEGLGKKGKGPHYESKTFVATDHPTAVRLASQGFSGLAKKLKGKRGGKGKNRSKKAI